MLAAAVLAVPAVLAAAAAVAVLVAVAAAVEMLMLREAPAVRSLETTIW